MTSLQVVAILLVAIAILFLFIVWTSFSQKFSWNRGVCRKCQNPWKFSNTDHRDGRNYTCECKHHLTMDYNWDKTK